jgi:hypothetical protein
VADRTRDDGLDPEEVKRKCQPGTANLRRVAAPPELAPQRPSDLEPVCVRNEWAADLIRGAYPQLSWEECVDLTPVVVDWRTRQSAAADDRSALAVVCDPFVNSVESPGCI